MARFWRRLIPGRSDEELTGVDVPEVHSSRNWLLLAAYFLAGLIVAVGVVFAARYIYQQTRDEEKKPVTANNTPAPQPSADGTPSTPPSPQNRPPTPSTLPNNGPENVAALFVLSSIAAGGVHYMVRYYRVSSASKR
jgi:uncharacterized membrane protein YraQ (UPF0718 family)